MDQIHATAFLGPDEVRDRWLSDDARPLRLRRLLDTQAEQLSV